MQTSLLLGLIILAQASPQAASGPVVLACELPTAGAPAKDSERIFRVSQGSLQEWDRTGRAFGNNLCEAFSCTKTAGRMEGAISSASVLYTIGVSEDGAGYWRAAGATGLAAKEGVCKVIASPQS